MSGLDSHPSCCPRLAAAVLRCAVLFLLLLHVFPTPQGQKEFLMRAHFGLPSVSSEDHMGVSANAKAPISVQFEIPYFTVSGIQVRYLKVCSHPTQLHACAVARTLALDLAPDGTGCCGHDARHGHSTLSTPSRPTHATHRSLALRPVFPARVPPLPLPLSPLARSLVQIIEKSGYQALPWVRYITQNGDYQIRMS